MRHALVSLILVLPVLADVTFYEPGFTAGVAVDEIDTPLGIDMASDGTLYVGHGMRSSFLPAQIHRVREGVVEPFGAVLLDPDAVAVDSQDRVYVGTRRGGIYRILPDGTTENFASNTAIVQGQPLRVLVNIDLMTIDDQDRIFATTTVGPSLTRVDPDGSVHVLRTYPTAPRGVRIGSDGALYIAFTAEGRILRYDPETGEERVFSAGLPGPIGLIEEPCSGDWIVTCNPYGYVPGTGRLFRVHRDGTWDPLADGLDAPADLFFDRSGRLLVTDELANRIWSIEGFGADGFAEVATVRERGKPVTIEAEFQVCHEGEVTIVATSGDDAGAHRVSSAIVWIDGVVVIPASSFNPRVGEVRVTVRLPAGEHRVSVEVRGSPGDLLRVRGE